MTDTFNALIYLRRLIRYLAIVDDNYCFKMFIYLKELDDFKNGE